MSDRTRDATRTDLHRQLLDALDALFGVHPGYRPVHAKGIVCEGTFTAADEARELSRAPHLQGAPIPVTVRFSDFTGLPDIPDADPNASPRGMAVKFHLPEGSETDLVAHSYDGFPARTEEEFLGLLRTLAAGASGAASPSPVETFAATHPAAKRFLEAPKAPPASFATESYFSADAFRFVNREGSGREGRYRIHPAGEERHLDPREAAARGPNYLFDELRSRLQRGPAQFRVMVQLAAPGDPTDDASAAWPTDRPQVRLGTLSVERLSDADERRLLFDPARLVDGIEPSGDPLIPARSRIYAISYQRRYR
ncbi:MAG TPA: catalase family peroxidase [Candidatus Dormibacteraeota bacterium]|jgi:catalase|nr:catalase family peroxidase [Candidatus Dormibacteraeota bacterium]